MEIMYFSTYVYVNSVFSPLVLSKLTLYFGFDQFEYDVDRCDFLRFIKLLEPLN